MKTNVVCIGDSGIDHYLEKNIQWVGGCSLNVAHHLSQCSKDMQVHLFSPLGTDPEAKLVQKKVERMQFFSHFEIIEGYTPVQSITNKEDGEKDFVEYREGVLREFEVFPQHHQFLSQFELFISVVFRQNLPLFESICSYLKKEQLIMDFMDLSDFDGSLTIVEMCLPQLAWGIFGLENAKHSKVEEIINFGIEKEKNFIITLGAKGSMVLHDGIIYRQQAIPVRHVLDTTGAGDAFLASFIANFYKYNRVGPAVLQANKYASKIVEKLGSY